MASLMTDMERRGHDTRLVATMAAADPSLVFIISTTTNVTGTLSEGEGVVVVRARRQRPGGPLLEAKPVDVFWVRNRFQPLSHSQRPTQLTCTHITTLQ